MMLFTKWYGVNQYNGIFACVLIRIWPTLLAYIVSWSVCRSILTPYQWKEWFCLFVLFELLRTIWSKLHHVASERELSRLLACLEARSQWYQSQLSCLWSKNWCLHECQWTQWLLCFWWIGINELPFVVTWRREIFITLGARGKIVKTGSVF